MQSRDFVVNDEGEIDALGFMLSDKESGPFTMEIESIKVVRLGEELKSSLDGSRSC